jgi:hypothetical protein
MTMCPPASVLMRDAQCATHGLVPILERFDFLVDVLEQLGQVFVGDQRLGDPDLDFGATPPRPHQFVDFV